MIRKSLLIVLVAVVGVGVVLLGGCKKKPASNPTTQKTGVKNVVAQYANTKCPIMGSIIKPEDVTADLVKDYKGQKVAFCCASCPPKWDALSDTEKAEKLVAAK